MSTQESLVFFFAMAVQILEERDLSNAFLCNDDLVDAIFFVCVFESNQYFSIHFFGDVVSINKCALNGALSIGGGSFKINTIFLDLCFINYQLQPHWNLATLGMLDCSATFL